MTEQETNTAAPVEQPVEERRIVVDEPDPAQRGSCLTPQMMETLEPLNDTAVAEFKTAIHPVTGQHFVTGDTVEWFVRAMPKPDARNVHVQLGVHFEEVAETLAALKMTGGGADAARAALTASLDQFAKALKAGEIFIDPVATNWPEVGDGLGDTRVTSTGSLHVIGAPVAEVVAEIDNSNWSKYVGGEALFDENGKVAKGPNFYRPNVKKLIPATPPAMLVAPAEV